MNNTYKMGSADLGDLIFLTPLFKYKNITTILPDCEASRWTSNIYHSLCDISFQDNIGNQINDWLTTEHKSVRILREFGFIGVNSIPYIIPKISNVVKMSHVLKQYKNPVIIQYTAKAYEYSRDIFATYRNVPDEQIDFTIKTMLDSGFTPICLIRPGKPYKSIKGVVFLEDISIDDFIASCFICKRYVGSDCGALHACLATGGKILGLIPDNHDSVFQHGMYVWKEEQFINEPVRAKYILFNSVFQSFEKDLNYLK